MWNTCKYPDCESWSSKKDGDYCYTHQRLSRKQIERDKKTIEKRNYLIDKARQKSKEPRKIPNKVSEKRKELNKEYFRLVEQFKKDNPQCKPRINGHCTISTEDPHHTKGRGVYLLDVSTWLPVCRSCHTYIESHPKEAIERGWSSSRLKKENPVI